MSEAARLNLMSTYLPIGAVAILIASLVGGILWLSSIDNQSKENARTTQEIKIDLKDYPTRREFDTLQKDVSDIKTGVNKINQYLIEKKP